MADGADGATISLDGHSSLGGPPRVSVSPTSSGDDWDYSLEDFNDDVSEVRWDGTLADFRRLRASLCRGCMRQLVGASTIRTQPLTVPGRAEGASVLELQVRTWGIGVLGRD